MVRKIAWQGFLLLLSAALFGCNGQVAGPSQIVSDNSVNNLTSAPYVPPNDTFFGPRTIAEGEEIRDALNSGWSTVYQFVAPSDGALVVRLTWETVHGSMQLKVNNSVFASNKQGVITGSIPAVAGAVYSLNITETDTWGYDLVPFTLTASTAR